MTHSAAVPESPVVRALPVTGALPSRSTAASAQPAFAQELAEARQVRFSAHAQKRLASRNLALDDKQLAGIARATDQAASRGAKDSLLVMDNMALVVHVPNRTVVTALDPARMQNGIVTNIDATVFVSTE